VGERLERTFAFVDIAGYTALTEVHGDESAADLAQRFYGFSEAVVASLPGGAVMRPLGDAVMLTFDEPGAAVAAVGELLAAAFADEGLPLLRAGMHHGGAIERDGDYFGAAVNLAARVAAQAHGSQVLGTATVADAAAAVGHEVIELGAFRFRNVIDEVELFDLRIGPPTEGGMTDPVCRMWVERDGASGRLRFEHHDYWFCSLECAERFAADPGRYAESEGAR
jgi:adenylate cyclase